MRIRVQEHKHRRDRVGGEVGIEVIMEDGGGAGMDISLGLATTIAMVNIMAEDRAIAGEGEEEEEVAAAVEEGRWEVERHTGVWMMLVRGGDMMEGLCMRISRACHQGIKGKVGVGTTNLSG